MNKLCKAMATVTIISAITRFLAFVFKIFLSRALGAEILGIYQITMSIFILLMALPSSGIPTALSRHIASLTASGDKENANGMLTSALLLSMSMSIVIIVLCYAFPNITSLLFTNKRCLNMFYIMLPALFSTSIYAIIRSYFWGHQQYFEYSSLELIEEVMSIIVIFVTLIFHLFGDDLSFSIAVAFVISDYIATFIIAIIFFLKGGRFCKPTLFKKLTSSAVPMTSTRLLGSLVSSLMALLLPVLLVKSGLSTAEATASYGRASGMVMPLIFVPSTIVGALAVVTIPRLAENKVKGIDIKKNITSALDFSMVVSSLFVAIFLSSGESIATLLYKDSIAGQYMSTAVLVMIPMSLNQMAVSILNTLGYENSTFKCHILCSAILMILVLILPNYIGIYAYFVSLIVFHSISMMIYLHLIKRKIGLDKANLTKWILLAIFSILVGICLKYFAKYISNIPLEIFVNTLLICVVYTVSIFKLKLVDVKIFKGLRKNKIS